jgi:hypothetical protein
VLTVVTGGVRTRLLGRDESLVDVHVLVPVSVRAGTLHTEPCSDANLVTLHLPVLGDHTELHARTQSNRYNTRRDGPTSSRPMAALVRGPREPPPRVRE